MSFKKTLKVLKLIYTIIIEFGEVQMIAILNDRKFGFGKKSGFVRASIATKIVGNFRPHRHST